MTLISGQSSRLPSRAPAVGLNPGQAAVDLTIDAVFRAEWGRLAARLVSRTRRLDLAEDALAEAFGRATLRWPKEGVPANPAGWLYTTAYRFLIGKLRAEAIAGRKAPLLAVSASWTPTSDELGAHADDRLHLILLCCHPALPESSRSALALRLVIGTTTDQIARLFLVPKATMAARLTRAKKKIAIAGIPLSSPVDEELQARLDEVCRTIYLAFTAGYTPGSGPDLLRADIAGDAVRLAAVLYEVVPNSAQVQALLALLLIQHSRRDARELDGLLVTLDKQNRALWHRSEIADGLELAAHLQPGVGFAEELRLQTLIAAEHATAFTARDTDWEAIAQNYGALEELTGSPIVRLNRAVAVGEADEPASGLALLAGLDELLRDNHRLEAIRGELARRAGDRKLAQRSYRRAIELCPNDVERKFLRDKLRQIP